MAAITFAKIMNCYPDNPMVYNHIKQDCGKLIPFVGAGLSVPCYLLWPKALKELAEQVAVPETKSSILEMIEGENPQLLEAAQALEDYWGQRGMADHLLELFSAAKIQENKGQLPHQSVWLLPLLFPGKPAVTTNFDRVLETVYHMQGCQFDTVILPNRQELHDLLIQGERHGLLKLHGDIGSETLEYSSIIFGKQQYEAAYQQGQPIVRDLKGWFSNKMLLFLGCSLKADEYLKLLQEVVQLHPGVTHYAILECEDVRNAAARARQLRDQWGIQALFYPKKRHEAVRVILEKLLEDHDPTAYQALPTHVGALPDQSPSSRFHYKSGVVSFHGRQEELEQLRAFCGQEHVAFRWWAVTGAGGAGKSRLVYEFGRKMEHADWNVLWLNSAHMDQLEALPIPTKTLVVVDYAQAYLGPLGHWLEQLAQRDHLVPVRLLLLERDGANLDSSSWGSGLKAEVRRAKSIRDSCWKETFLQLFPLRDEALLRIMTDFAVTVGKSLPEAKAQQLLDTLKTTDPELRRPLYAMFLADAWANGKEPEQWGQKAVLDYVLQRENEYFEEKTKETIGNIPRLKKNLNKLRLVATIWDGITLKQVAQEYPKLWEAFQQQAEKVECVESEEDLLRQVGLIKENGLTGLKPDLLGEYFVLQNINEPEVLQMLFPDGWQAKVEVVTFLFRMYLDYHNELENVRLFWHNILFFPTGSMRRYGMMLVNIAGFSNAYAVPAVESLKMLWETGGKLAIDALLYAQGLYNLSNKQQLDGKEAIIERLGKLQEQYSWDQKIAFVYAQGLFNLTSKQKLEGREVTVERLKELQERYSGNEEIALAYAQGLVNLANKQPMEEAEATIRRLQEMHERNSGSEEIALVYVQCLVSLASRQEIDEYAETIRRLGAVYKVHPKNAEIAVAYAQVLFNLHTQQAMDKAEETIGLLEALSKAHPEKEEVVFAYAKALVMRFCKQEWEEALSSVNQLSAVCEMYPKSEKIVALYAMGVLNLSCRQVMKERLEIILKRLEFAYEICSENEEIALCYAKGLFNLSVKQTGEERGKTVERLESVSKEHPGNEEIAFCYAKGLFNLSVNQSIAEKIESVERLKTVSNAYPGNWKIALRYAKGLANLCAKQTAVECVKTIERLKTVHNMYQKNEKIALRYAQGLVNLSAKQMEAECEKTIGKLKMLSGAYPGNNKLIVEYAVGLFNLSTKQGMEKSMETIERLETLSKAYPRRKEISYWCARSLLNLYRKQTAEECIDTVRRLGAVSKVQPRSEAITRWYVNILLDLSIKQDVQKCVETIGRLKEVNDAHPGNEITALGYAKGLVNLSVKQTAEECIDTVRQLQEMNAVFPENEAIAHEYAKGLFNLSTKQKVEECSKTIRRLEILSKAYFKNEEIATVYAKGLLIMSTEQGIEQAIETIGKVEKLSKTYLGNEEIAFIYAISLSNISTKQEVNKSSETVKRLKELHSAYLSNGNIAVAYAAGLANLAVGQSAEEAQITISILCDLCREYPENQNIKLILMHVLENQDEK